MSWLRFYPLCGWKVRRIALHSYVSSWDCRWVGKRFFRCAFWNARMSTKVVASFLIRPVWDFQGDTGSLEEILLYLGAEITFISEHHAIDIPIGHRWGGGCHGHLPSSCQRNGRHNLFCRQRAAYIHSNVTLARRNSPSLEWRCCYHVPWYNVLPLRFGRPWSAWSRYRTHPRSHVLSDFFCKACCLFASGIELPTADKVWQVVFTLFVQSMKQKILTVEAKCLGCDAENHNFKVREFRYNTTSWNIFQIVDTIDFLRNPCGFWWNLIWSCV